MTSKVALIFAGILFISTKIYAAQEIFPFVAEVVSGSVNVRAGQNVNFETIGTLEKGQLVIVIGKNYSWYKIELPESSKSYIIDKYVNFTDDKTAFITGDRVNIRAEASDTSSILGQVKKDDIIEVLENKDGWLKIKPIKNCSGWISEKYLKFKTRNTDEYYRTLVKDKIPTVDKKAQKSPPLISDNGNIISITGYLKLLEPKSENIQYKFEADNNSTYFIKGFKYIFDEFLGYKLLVEGTLEKNDHVPPVLNVTKIQLIF